MKLKNPALLCTHTLIDGEWVKSNSGESYDVTNPASGEVVASVPAMGVEETRHAIVAAERALPLWSAKTAKERAKILRKWADLMMDNQEDLAAIMTAEQGKPLSESRGEIAYAASFLEWFAEEGKRAYGEVIPSPIKNARILTIKQPVGVCALITPWNFPSAMITRKAGPALAAGCTVVAKPAKDTPLSALALAVLAEEAGVPRGVFNVVTGPKAREIGDELCANPVVRKLSFTGSTAVGKVLMKQCAGTMKRLSLELGGNAPFIVFEDADLDAAVEGAVVSKYRNAGQTCVCANRLFVHETVYDSFVQKLSKRVAALTVGDGTADDTLVGPMINDDAVKKAEEFIADAQEKGARILTGGKVHDLAGRFFEPTVLADVTPGMKVAEEEIFGPIAPVFKFTDEAEVIRLANDTPYGLAAYFYARDMARIWRVSEALEYGMVAVNTGILSTEVAPFGGIKESGMGREGSKYGLDEYLEIKYVLMGGIQ